MLMMYVIATRSHPKTSYDWRFGTSFDHTSIFACLGPP